MAIENSGVLFLWQVVLMCRDGSWQYTHTAFTLTHIRTHTCPLFREQTPATSHLVGHTHTQAHTHTHTGTHTHTRAHTHTHTEPETQTSTHTDRVESLNVRHLHIYTHTHTHTWIPESHRHTLHTPNTAILPGCAHSGSLAVWSEGICPEPNQSLTDYLQSHFHGH